MGTGASEHLDGILLSALLANEIDNDLGSLSISDVLNLVHVPTIGEYGVINAPLSCEIEGHWGLINYDNLRRSESLQTLYADMAQAPSTNDDNLCAWVKQVAGLLDGMIGSETCIGQGSNIFRSQAGVQLDDRTRTRLEKVSHAAINRNAGECRVTTVHVVASAAGTTEATGDERMHNYRIAYRDIADGRADSFDPASVLMAKGVWQSHTGFFCPLP